jgi:hypothetical protein
VVDMRGLLLAILSAWAARETKDVDLRTVVARRSLPLAAESTSGIEGNRLTLEAFLHTPTNTALREAAQY